MQLSEVSKLDRTPDCIAKIYKSNKTSGYVCLTGNQGELAAYDEDEIRDILSSHNLKPSQSVITAIVNDIVPQRRQQIEWAKCKMLADCAIGRCYTTKRGSILQPLPIGNTTLAQVDVGFVVGPSGSGKSTYIAKWVAEYYKMHPKYPVFLFSRKSEDVTLDSLEEPDGKKLIKRIPVDDSVFDISIDDALDIFSKSACIFDDIDTIANNDVREYIRKLRDDLIETGRSSEISVICTSHVFRNYGATKKIANEASFVTVFLGSGSGSKAVDFLKKDLDLCDGDILRAKQDKSRWVTVYTRAPRYIITEHSIILL